MLGTGSRQVNVCPSPPRVHLRLPRRNARPGSLERGSCRHLLTPVRRGLVCVYGWLAGKPAADGSARATAVCGSDITRYGPRRHLHLPAIGTVLAEQAGLEKDFAESIQGFGNMVVYPGFATAQHLRDFIPGEGIQSDQGDHLGMLLAEPCKT